MKTKLNLLAMFLGAMLAALPDIVNAQFAYTTNNGSITITKFTGGSSVVVIPGSTNGFPVTSIGNSAFEEWSVPTSITIPNSVTNIGNFAFAWCTSMTQHQHRNQRPQHRNQCVRHLHLMLRGVTIPNKVINIGYDAFIFCAGLTNLTIGTNVASIGASAFSGCSKLPRVTIPGSATNIGNNAFFGCTSLTTITVDANNPAYSSRAGVLFDKSQTTILEYPKGGPGTYTIPDSVTNVADHAFDGCTNLTSLTIDTNVISIGVSAIAGCSCLPTETIPNSVSGIGFQAFFACSSMTNIIIGTNVTSMGDLMFYGCNVLPAITVDPNNPAFSSLAGVLFSKTRP